MLEAGDSSSIVTPIRDAVNAVLPNPRWCRP